MIRPGASHKALCKPKTFYHEPVNVAYRKEQSFMADPTPEEAAAIQQARRSRAQRAYDVITGTDPWILLSLGALVGVMWAIATVTQIRTSEMLMLSGGRVPLDVQWGVFLQPYQLIIGAVPSQYMGAYSYGWFIECITLVWAWALEHAVVKMRETNAHLGKWYGIVSFALISLNSWADFNNSPGPDPLSQALMAVSIGLMSVTGLPIALVLFKAGLAKMGAH
jgi:hypothetical protein